MSVVAHEAPRISASPSQSDASIFAAAASGLKTSRRHARALATACAALVGAGLALGSISRLAGSAVLSDTSLLLMYELTLVVAPERIVQVLARAKEQGR